MSTLSNELLARKIENIIQDAEVAAALDKSMYAEMDNQLMNRQTLLLKIQALVATQNTALLKELSEQKRWVFTDIANIKNPDMINFVTIKTFEALPIDLINSKLAAMGEQNG